MVVNLDLIKITTICRTRYQFTFVKSASHYKACLNYIHLQVLGSSLITENYPGSTTHINYAICSINSAGIVVGGFSVKLKDSGIQQH
jgi:hypothetical protein